MTVGVIPGLAPGILYQFMNSTAFSYKPGSSFMHRCPVWLKLLLIPLVSIAAFKLPFYFALGLCAAQMILAFILRFTIREQLRDLKAVLYYAAFLIFAKVIGNLAANGFYNIPQRTIPFLIAERETWVLLLRLLCVMQTASLLFKTSTSLQIREGLERIETSIRRKPHAPVAQAVSLFICFIPQVSKNWQQAERAWRARGGRRSLRMFIVLLPVLFSVGMKQAYNTARAISVRSPEAGGFDTSLRGTQPPEMSRN